MSRYSYKVEKLLRESKSPSLDILLEEEGEEKEEAPSDSEEKEDEGIPEDPFGGDDKDGEEDSAGDAEEDKGDNEEAQGCPAELAATLKRLEKFVSDSDDAGKEISDSSHKFKGIAREFMSDLNKLSAKEISPKKAFESASYVGRGIKNFIFEEEDKSQEAIESSIEDLTSKLNSEENQLPDALDIAKMAYRYFERFDEVDRAIYIIKLVSKFFKKFINPEKDKVFEEFLEKFVNILHDNGVDLELDKSTATKYRNQVGARQAAG